MRIPFIIQPRSSVLTAILLGSVALGCGGRGESAVTPPPISPTDVALTLALTTPHDDDGAVLVTITGPSVLGVVARPGLEADESQVTSNGLTTSTIIFRGNLANGPIGEIRVRGADAGAAYTVQVRQVAARASGGYALRTDLNAYRLTIQR
jgi:hypothetical protein